MYKRIEVIATFFQISWVNLYSRKEKDMEIMIIDAPKKCNKAMDATQI